MNNGSFARLALVATLAATAAAAATTETVVDVPVGSVTERFLYVRPDSPSAIVISLAGNDGILGIQNDGTMPTLTAQCSPIARNRQAFAQAGLALALLDANSSGSPPGYDEVVQVVSYMRARHKVPVWVTGGSASTGLTAIVASRFPGPTPLGALFFSPGLVGASLAGSITRPALVIGHTLDTSFPAALYAGLTAAPVKDLVVLTGGSNANCGYHLFNGLDAEFVAALTGFVARNNAATVALPGNFQGLWWRSPAGSESGWGVNVAQQGDILFATWFTYDAAGDGLWLVMPSGQKTGPATYSGKLYRTTGPPFNATTFDPSKVVVTEAGTATFTFVDASNGTFQATVGGASITKPITRQVYSQSVPDCAAGTAASATNFQDLWWAAPAGSESGWGVNITHQGDVLFATWFTYGSDGRGIWLVMSEGRKQADGSYQGALYQTRGPAFDASPWNPANVAVSAVGTASFRFRDATNATFSYVVNGIAQSKAITRQVYASPITVCN